MSEVHMVGGTPEDRKRLLERFARAPNIGCVLVREFSPGAPRRQAAEVTGVGAADLSEGQERSRKAVLDRAPRPRHAGRCVFMAVSGLKNDLSRFASRRRQFSRR
jgi:hypothetical protein